MIRYTKAKAFHAHATRDYAEHGIKAGDAVSFYFDRGEREVSINRAIKGVRATEVMRDFMDDPLMLAPITSHGGNAAWWDKLRKAVAGVRGNAKRLLRVSR
jgi:hypothetical protein